MSNKSQNSSDLVTRHWTSRTFQSILIQHVTFNTSQWITWNWNKHYELVQKCWNSFKPTQLACVPTSRYQSEWIIFASNWNNDRALNENDTRNENGIITHPIKSKRINSQHWRRLQERQDIISARISPCEMLSCGRWQRCRVIFIAPELNRNWVDVFRVSNGQSFRVPVHIKRHHFLPGKMYRKQLG